MRARQSALCTFLFLFLAAGTARADAAGIAIELFTQGKQLMNAGDYAEARVRLKESARLDPKVGTLASLAVCEERLGHLADAHARWQQARTLATATNDPRRPLTESELARIDRVVPKLTINVRGPSASGLIIKADDLEVGPGVLGTALPVNPGDHTVSATAPGKRPWSTQVHTDADGKTIVVDVGPLEDAPASGDDGATTSHAFSVSPTEPLPLQTPSGWRAQRTVGIVVTGVGAAGLVLGGVSGLQTLLLKNDRNKFCDANNVCTSQQGVSDDRSARNWANVSTIALAVGGAITAGGIALILTAPRGAPAVTVGADLQPGGAEFKVAGRW